MDARHARQAGLVDAQIFENPVTVVGAGGIGSFTTLALAKIGFTDIKVFDDDKIEQHNLGNQFYRLGDMTKPKVFALSDIVMDFEGTRIQAVPEKYDIPHGTDLRGMLISAVDSMRARKLIYKSVKDNKGLRGFIDGRMGGNQLEVYTVDMRDSKSRELYEKTLWDDAQTASVPCTQKAVMYNVLTIASWIVNQTRLLLSGKPFNRELILDLENMILVQDARKK